MLSPSVHWFLWIISSGLILVLYSCEADKEIPDVSDISVEIEIQRFEQDLFALDTNTLAAGVADLRSTYGVFFENVYMYIMADPTIAHTSDTVIVQKILTSPLMQELYDTTMVVYGDISSIEAELEQAFRYFKYYFPERPVPDVVSYISEFALGTFTYGDSLMGVGWDFFLGDGYKYYDLSIFPQYIQRTMSRPYIVPKMVEAVAGNLAGEAPAQRLLDQMITNGKILYLKDLFLPHTPDSIKMEYTTEQMLWVRKNEGNIWSHFLNEELLYSTKMQDIQKLVNPSPGAPGGMPREAPGRVGNWMGWQIIKALMANNPELTPAGLLALKDSQKILEMSRYKPRR